MGFADAHKPVNRGQSASVDYAVIGKMVPVLCEGIMDKLASQKDFFTAHAQQCVAALRALPEGVITPRMRKEALAPFDVIEVTALLGGKEPPARALVFQEALKQYMHALAVITTLGGTSESKEDECPNDDIRHFWEPEVVRMHAAKHQLMRSVLLLIGGVNRVGEFEKLPEEVPPGESPRILQNACLKKLHADIEAGVKAALAQSKAEIAI